MVTHNVFYSPTVRWYIGLKSHLGLLGAKTSEYGFGQRAFFPGQILRELEQHATALDQVCARGQKASADYEYHKNCMINNFNAVINDVEGLVAFMQYKGQLWVGNDLASVQALDKARYLFNMVNQVGLDLAQAFEQEESKKELTYSIVKRFIVELETILTSFWRIESEIEK